MSQFFKTKEETQQWLDNAGVQNYTINDDLTIDVDGHVDLSGKYDIQNEQYSSVMIDGKLPVQFGKVTGDFDVFEAGLTSLEGIPKKIGGYFDCSFNKLTSLEHSPDEIAGEFNCIGNEIASLLGSPQNVGGDYYCSNNKISSLEGITQSIHGHFECHSNELLNLYHAPLYIQENMEISNNLIQSFKGIDLNMSISGNINCDFTKDYNHSREAFNNEKSRIEKKLLESEIKTTLKKKVKVVL